MRWSDWALPIELPPPTGCETKFPDASSRTSCVQRIASIVGIVSRRPSSESVESKRPRSEMVSRRNSNEGDGLAEELALGLTLAEGEMLADALALGEKLAD
jgi:hypothetical protein